MQVYLTMDDRYSVLLWDQDMLEVIDPKSEHLERTEVPDELVKEYVTLSTRLVELENRLYNDYYRPPGRPVQL
jgi:hypothetical protein